MDGNNGKDKVLFTFVACQYSFMSTLLRFDFLLVDSLTRHCSFWRGEPWYPNWPKTLSSKRCEVWNAVHETQSKNHVIILESRVSREMYNQANGKWRIKWKGKQKVHLLAIKRLALPNACKSPTRRIAIKFLQDTNPSAEGAFYPSVWYRLYACEWIL